MTYDFTGGEKRILKAAWLMEHEKSVGKAFCSFLLIFVVAYVCKRIILGRKINDIRFMLIDLKFFPALLASLLACNCQRGLGFYVRKTAQSSLNQPPWGQFGSVFPHPLPLSLSLYLRLPHTGFLWLFPSLNSLQTPPFGLSLLAKSSSDQVDIKHFIHLCTPSTQLVILAISLS